MAVTFGGNWYDGGNYIHSSLHASLPGDAHVDWAGDIPAAITKCNQAIFDLGGEDENNAEQEALIAPALAMTRATEAAITPVLKDIILVS